MAPKSLDGAAAVYDGAKNLIASVYVNPRNDGTLSYFVM